MPRKPTKPTSYLSATRGMSIRIDLGGKKATFTAGGRRRVLVDEVYDGKGTVYVNGKIRLADGTEVFAVLGIDETSSGEHCDTGIWTPAGFVWQDGIASALGKTVEQVFPYRYHYAADLVRCHDHHVGEDGWSVR